MNVCRFINSRAVREHLENLDYSFTTPEAAYIACITPDMQRSTKR